MARTKREQWLMRVRGDVTADRLAAVGEHWVRADLVATWLCMQIGERKYNYEKTGREPWSDYVRRSFYKVFDALPENEQKYFMGSHDSLGVPMPERPIEERRAG